MNLNFMASPLLQGYLTDKFGSISINEINATCDDCLCAKTRCETSRPLYRRDLKCCTFHPFLSNFTVGALLEQPEAYPDVVRVLKHKIASRAYALPLGVFAPVRYQVAFNQRQPEEFGNNQDLLCPYFDKQSERCGAWLYRGPVCTSYYCESSYGEAGLLLWQHWGEYLHQLEMILAQDCLVSMGLSHEIIDYQLEYINCETGTPDELASDSMEIHYYKEMWESWPENEESFYRSSFKYARSLSLKDLRVLFDDEVVEATDEIKNLLLNLGQKL